MLIRTDPTDPVPIYRQIAAQVTEQALENRLSPGERLPTAAELAAGLGVNRNTVLQAYRLLRDDGVIDLRRGRGAVVRAPARHPGTPSPTHRPAAPAAPSAPPRGVDELVAALARAAGRAGLGLETVTAMLKKKGLN